MQSSDVVQIPLRTGPGKAVTGSAGLGTVAAGVAKRPGSAPAGRACRRQWRDCCPGFVLIKSLQDNDSLILRSLHTKEIRNAVEDFLLI